MMRSRTCYLIEENKFNEWDGPKYSLGQQAKDKTYHAFNQYKKIVIARLKFPDFNQLSMIFNQNEYYRKYKSEK